MFIDSNSHRTSNNSSVEEIVPLLLDIIVKENGRPIPRRILFNKLVKNNQNIGYVRSEFYEEAINQLISSQKIISLRTGDLIGSQFKRNSSFGQHHNGGNSLRFSKIVSEESVDKTKPLVGSIHINTVGNGFIKLQGDTEAKYFVSREQLCYAQENDVVEFYAGPKGEGSNLFPAIVNKIIEHSKDYYVGEYVVDQNGYSVILDDLKTTFKCELDNNDGLVNGSKILLKINKFEGDKIYASVNKIIGHKSDVGVDILSVIYDNGVTPDFPNDVLEFAKKLSVNLKDDSMKIRRDYTAKPIVTIDPATSKDFDDAFYCEKLSDGRFMLSVHIADVSHYVKYTSILDNEALKRGCSIYLVDRVIPMLPHNLSDDVCSLNPNVERFTIGCDMIINQAGMFEKIDVYPAIIKSHRRFSYDDVNEYFDKKNDFSKEEKAVKDSIDAGLKLSDILSAMKNKRGYIDFEIPEPEIIVNEKGEVTEIKKRVHGRAQKMIEDFMVAANEAVTIHADKMKYPFVYRIHEKPSDQKISSFSMIAKKLNFKISGNVEHISPLLISQWLEANKDNPNLDIARTLLLRSMSKAKYDTKNIGHFGLSSKNYTHFTSPIRRYPDLLVHRIFWECEFNRGKDRNLINKLSAELKSYADLSSKNELVAVKCEREVNKMKFAEYMEKHIGEHFTGYINSITSFGAFVILDNLIEGLVPIRSIPGDVYRFSADENVLIGQSSKKTISLCTKVEIEVVLAEKRSKKIEFKIINFLNS